MSKIISTVLGSKLNAGSWIFREKQDLSCREPDRKESNAIQRLFEGKEGFGVQVHLDFKWKNLHEKRQRLCCPLFKSLEIIKFLDLVTFHLAIFMYKYRNQLFPSVFNSFFTKISQIHTYNTRLGAKQSYYLPKARTNYGIFNVRFQGPSVWNSIDEDIKLSSLSLFKKKMKQHFIKDY